MIISDVKRLAELSRLAFSDEQLESFSDQFSKIVDYIGVVTELDLEGVEPMLSVNETVNVFRPDVVGDCVSTADALSNAPKKNEAFFKVPKVL